MEPKLRDGEYVFTCIAAGRYGDAAELAPIAMFMEDEGMTLVVPRHSADEHGVNYASVFKCITLCVHSSLNAVGFTAAFSKRLADNGLGANVIAGYFHDHIFVPSECAESAMAALGDGC